MKIEVEPLWYALTYNIELDSSFNRQVGGTLPVHKLKMCQSCLESRSRNAPSSALLLQRLQQQQQ